jgi:glutamate-ammonia-ligase adenylyltransferase
LVEDRSLGRAVAVVLASCPLLVPALVADGRALDALAWLDRPEPVDRSSVDALVAWKQRSLLRIAARDLLGESAFEETVAAISAVAAASLDAAIALTGPGTEALAVVAMGKLGGAELNYASDVDLLVVGPTASADEQRLARRLLSTASRIWPVDTALRPEGRDGALVRTVDGFASHWDRWAEPWELQALLKARPVAGDPGLGAAFAAAAAERLWSAPWSAADLRAVRLMKDRTETTLKASRGQELELKRGRGGIRDIEFATQLLQLVHGRHDPALRVRGTVPALAALSDGGYVDAGDAGWLRSGYRFLRRVEHALQLDGAGPTPGVPSDPVARARLARTLGFPAGGRAGALAQLDRELGACRAAVRTVHERLYFRPLLEAFAGVEVPLSPDAAADRLAAFGFSSGERTRQAVVELTSGLSRSSKLMLQLLPLLLDWLSTTPDPDAGLLGLRQLATGPTRATAMANAFRDSPETARRLAVVLGTSRTLGAQLVRNPDLLEVVGGADRFVARSSEELAASARVAVDLRDDTRSRRRALRRFTDREGLRIGAYDVLGLVDEDDDASPEPVVGGALSRLAVAALEVAVEHAAPEVPFAALALGHLGGEEMGYSSDLDLQFVHGGEGPDAQAEAERAAADVVRFLEGDTPASRVYDVDLDLRPEGRNGPLARSLDGYRAYFERWAETWERQAMVRARPVAGDLVLGRVLLAELEPFVWAPLSDDDRRAIRRMKARIEAERVPPGEDPAFHLKLGPGGLADVEFCAQLLQLEHGVRTTGTVATIERLRALGALADDEAAALVDAHRFCDRARNRWFLVRGLQADSLPAGDDLARLAHSLGTTGPGLREQYRRVTRRARRVVEHRFYARS